MRRADVRLVRGIVSDVRPQGLAVQIWRLGAHILDHATKEFSVTFQFDGNVEGNPMDYVVLVYGFQDDSRTVTIGQSGDPLAYARIRVPE